MITVLRLGHRLKRDERLSTHCGLAARAFGAAAIIYSGERDAQLVESISSVAKRWGGPFRVRHDGNWRKVIQSYKKKKYTVVHLTMYGLPLQAVVRNLRRKKKLLIVIGSEKVPPEVYQLADYNVSVTSQPHSEVAALAVFLHEYFFSGKEKKFRNAQLRIVPQARGKKMIGKNL